MCLRKLVCLKLRLTFIMMFWVDGPDQVQEILDTNKKVISQFLEQRRPHFEVLYTVETR